MRSTRTTIDSTATASGNKAPSLALTIAYHPNIDRVGQRAILTAASTHEPIVLSREKPSFFAPGSSSGEPLADEHISRSPISITNAADGTVHINVSESKTKVHIANKQILGSVKLAAEEIDRGVVLLLGKRIVLVLHRTQQIGRVLDYDKLIGESDGLCRVLWDIKNVAGLEIPVLLRGETGTGKELVATAIHRLSRRSQKDYRAVNLPAIPTALAAAELFGAEKGSYTGSINRHVGYFEQVEDGTLFLDEIGDAPHELQLPLYRAVELGEIQTVGSTQTRRINVRIIAATDVDLESKVAEGSFRAPLLNRLATYEIWIPPLRERREDIGLLLVAFLRKEFERIDELHRLKAANDTGKLWLPASLVAKLIDFDWPGNVRQLINVVQQLVIGNRGREQAEETPTVAKILREKPGRKHAIPLPEFAPPVTNDVPSKSPAEVPLEENKEPDIEPPMPGGPGPNNPPRRKPADVTEAELREAWRTCRWEFVATADMLGIARPSLYALRERFTWLRAAGDLTVEEIKECHSVCNGDIALMAEKVEVSERGLARRAKELGLTLKTKQIIS